MSGDRPAAHNAEGVRPADVPAHYVHCVDGACAQPCWHDPTYHDPPVSLCGIHRWKTAGCPACQYPWEEQSDGGQDGA